MNKLSVLILSLTMSLTAFSEEKKMEAAKPTANPKVMLETSEGNIVLEIFQDKAPESAKNFLKYVDDGFYTDTVFHRVIETFMIQGGGFDKTMNQKKTRAAIKNESSNGLKNERGTLAMARTSVPDSATAQFFINVVDNAFLNKDKSQDGVGYAVFGKVVDAKGMEVVDKIRKVKTNQEDVPEKQMVILKAKRM